MSDCTVRWGDTEWHTPDGRTIFLGADDMPCTVSVVFTDGSQRDIHIALAGREVDHVSVDGVVYEPRGRAESDETSKLTERNANAVSPSF